MYYEYMFRRQNLRPCVISFFLTTVCLWLWVWEASDGRRSLSDPSSFLNLKSLATTTAVPKVAHKFEPFPPKIWQSWKTSVADLNEDDRAVVQAWRKLNPEHRYELLTDDAAATYVRDRFSDHPAIAETFLGLTDRILRADLLRYLILAADGGVYTDIDTLALKPIRDWIPPWYQNQARLVVGIEIDEPFVKSVFWHYSFQLCQWTMMSQPHHPAMEKAVQRTVHNLEMLADRQNTSLSGIVASLDDVLATTGPGVFTDAIFEDLAERYQLDISWANLTGLTEPKLLGDILMLPVTSFAPDQTHSNSGPSSGETALVKHLFKGSWRNDHPIEGEEKSEEPSSSDEQTQSIEVDNSDPPVIAIEPEQAASQSAREGEVTQTVANEEEQRPTENTNDLAAAVETPLELRAKRLSEPEEAHSAQKDLPRDSSR